MPHVRPIVSALIVLALAGVAPSPEAAPSPAPAKAKARVAPADEKAIRAAVLAYLESLRLMRGVAVEVEAVSGPYARARAVPPPDSTDPAWVFAKKVKGRWKVVAGPGTAFARADLQRLGVPRALWISP